MSGISLFLFPGEKVTVHYRLHGADAEPLMHIELGNDVRILVNDRQARKLHAVLGAALEAGPEKG